MYHPLISVLIPCWNAESTIVETLESVLGQTLGDVETLVVDDGSQDRTREVVDSYRKSGVRLIEQNHRGAAAARNCAFELSRGKYVIYLDADDIINREHLKALLGVIESESDVAVSQWDRFYHRLDEAGFPPRPTNTTLPGVDWLLLDWEADSMTQCGMFLFPRALIERWGGWNASLSLCDDLSFFRVSLAGWNL